VGKNYMSVDRDTLDRNRRIFFRSVEVRDGCWGWKLFKDHDGYGKFGWKWRVSNITKESAHIISWVIHNGSNVPDGMEICHICDNRECCNPEHLFIATHAENLADMARKGRHWDSSGENNPYSILTERDVKFIKHSGIDKRDMAEMFGVSRGAIRDILSGRSWKFVE